MNDFVMRYLKRIICGDRRRWEVATRVRTILPQTVFMATFGETSARTAVDSALFEAALGHFIHNTRFAGQIAVEIYRARLLALHK